MANTVITLKKSATPSQVPGDLANGELAINYADGKLFYKDSTGSIQEISSGGNTFSTINAAGTFVVAGLPNDILELDQGNNIIITGDSLNNKIAIAANLIPAFDYANSISVSGGDPGPAFNKANDAYSLAQTAFDKANTANVLAYGTGIGANAYADSVGLSSNNFSGVMSNSVNAIAITMDTAGNNYTNAVGIGANTWANTKLANTDGVVFEGTLNIKNNLFIGNNITNVSSIIFNTSTNRVPTNPGELTWSQDDSTLHFDMDTTTNVIGHIGQDVFYYVKNQTGSSIAKGTVVRFAGTLGASGRLLIAPAIANNSYPSKYVMGVTATSIANGDDGFVLSQGKLRQIDTSMFSEGDILYVSPSTPGAFSNTMPTAPNNKITVAAVVKKDNTVGAIEIRLTLGSKLNEDELVELNNLTNGDINIYNSANGRFENKVQLSLNAGSVNGLSANTIIEAANGYSRVFANSVGTAANANLSVSTISANNFAGTMANSVNSYTSETYSTITFASSAYDKSNTANVLACTAFDKANSANVLAKAAYDYANSIIAGGATISATAPASPSAGSFWWNSTYGRLFLYYTDTDTSQWVDAAPAIDYGLIWNTANAAFDKANASSGSTGSSNWLYKTANYTANVGDKIYCNTVPGFITITLPLSPGTGNSVTISSGFNATNANVIIARNGSTIMGINEDMVITDDNITVELMYMDSTWRIG